MRSPGTTLTTRKLENPPPGIFQGQSPAGHKRTKTFFDRAASGPGRRNPGRAAHIASGKVDRSGGHHTRESWDHHPVGIPPRVLAVFPDGEENLVTGSSAGEKWYVL